MAYNEISSDYVEVWGASNKTWQALLFELYGKIDKSKIKNFTKCALELTGTIVQPESYNTGVNHIFTFGSATCNSTAGFMTRIIMQSTAANTQYHVVRCNVGGANQFVNNSSGYTATTTYVRFYYG